MPINQLIVASDKRLQTTFRQIFVKLVITMVRCWDRNSTSNWQIFSPFTGCNGASIFSSSTLFVMILTAVASVRALFLFEKLWIYFKQKKICCIVLLCEIKHFQGNCLRGECCWLFNWVRRYLSIMTITIEDVRLYSKMFILIKLFYTFFRFKTLQLFCFSTFNWFSSFLRSFLLPVWRFWKAIKFTIHGCAFLLILLEAKIDALLVDLKFEQKSLRTSYAQHHN